MKKILLATAFLLAGATSAQAEINVDIGMDQPAYVEPSPVYVAPRPVIVEHPQYYNSYSREHHHRDYDWSYWNQHHDAAAHRDLNHDHPVHR